ncbi:MAG TPA: MFS transporter [Actinomycetaceae bacterium]|nr:MFS transporter [Actinomycetaceae bacterium]
MTELDDQHRSAQAVDPAPRPDTDPEAAAAVAADPALLPGTASIQRRTLIVLVISQVIGTIGVGVAPSIGVLLAGEVTDNEAWAGLARTASTLGAALAGIPLGTLAAHRGRRFALTSGWWTAATGSALLVPAAQWSLMVPMFIGLLMIGVGSAVALQARFAATDLAPRQRKARALSLVVWVGTLGSVLGPNLGLPGKAISAGTGLSVYAAAFLIAATTLGLAGLIVFIWLRPDPLLALMDRTSSDAAPPPVTSARTGRLRRIFEELKVNRRARYAVLAILTAQIVMVSLMTITPVHLSRQGDTVTIIGLTISLHIAGMYALAPVVGTITDRFGPRATVGVGIIILLASFLIGGLRPSDTTAIVASLILLGVGWSFVNVAGSALFSAVVSDEARASAQGGVDAMSNLCGATAAFAAGPLLVLTSFSTLAVLAGVLMFPLMVATVRAEAR